MVQTAPLVCYFITCALVAHDVRYSTFTAILPARSTLVFLLIALAPDVAIAIAVKQERYFAKQYGADRYARLLFYYMRPSGA